jgi:hypothetical protein
MTEGPLDRDDVAASCDERRGVEVPQVVQRSRLFEQFGVGPSGDSWS